MSNLKFRSPYTGKEYELEAFEKEEGNGTLLIVSHTSLKNLLNNELRDELEIQYDVKMLLVSQGHCVAQCTIKDKHGRRSQELGESTATTLETPIAKGFPATTAFNRALDRCIIAHLGFKGRVYSSEEISDFEKETVPPDSAEKTSREVLTPKQPPQQKAPPSAPRQTTYNNAAQLGDTVIKLARYSGNPQKLSVLWKTDAPMVNWICDSYTPSGPAAEKVKQACIQYRDLMKGN